MKKTKLEKFTGALGKIEEDSPSTGLQRKWRKEFEQREKKLGP